MSELIKTSDFDPLVPWIREIRTADRFIKIQLPSTFLIDEKQIVLFLDDAAIEFVRRNDALMDRHVTGFVRDVELFAYLAGKYKTSPFAFEMHFSPEFENALKSFR